MLEYCQEIDSIMEQEECEVGNIKDGVTNDAINIMAESMFESVKRKFEYVGVDVEKKEEKIKSFLVENVEKLMKELKD